VFKQYIQGVHIDEMYVRGTVYTACSILLQHVLHEFWNKVKVGQGAAVSKYHVTLAYALMEMTLHVVGTISCGKGSSRATEALLQHSMGIFLLLI